MTEFWGEIKHDDIVTLVETHIHSDIEDELSIPGFRRLNHKNRSLDKNSFKSSGGITVFVKETLSKYVIPINNTNNIHYG